MELDEFEIIDDPSDARLQVFTGLRDQQLRQVREAPGGDLAGVFIAEGDVVIQRALDAGHRLRSVIVEAARSRSLEFDLGRAPLYRMGEPVVQAIANHRRYRGAMGCFDRPAAMPVAELIGPADVVLVTEGVNNPTNMGAMIRTAAALGVDALLVDPASCDPLARRANRVSMGAVFTLAHGRLEPLPDGLAPLRAAGFVTVALTPGHGDDTVTDLNRLNLAPDAPVALLLGAEEPGLTPATRRGADHQVRIPMHAGIDSLNVATAAAIAMWEVIRTRD